MSMIGKNENEDSTAGITHDEWVESVMKVSITYFGHREQEDFSFKIEEG